MLVQAEFPESCCSFWLPLTSSAQIILLYVTLLVSFTSHSRASPKLESVSLLSSSMTTDMELPLTLATPSSLFAFLSSVLAPDSAEEVFFDFVDLTPFFLVVELLDCKAILTRSPVRTSPRSSSLSFPPWVDPVPKISRFFLPFLFAENQ